MIENFSTAFLFFVCDDSEQSSNGDAETHLKVYVFMEKRSKTLYSQPGSVLTHAPYISEHVNAVTGPVNCGSSR